MSKSMSRYDGDWAALPLSTKVARTARLLRTDDASALFGLDMAETIPLPDDGGRARTRGVAPKPAAGARRTTARTATSKKASGGITTAKVKTAVPNSKAKVTATGRPRKRAR